jgi:cellulose synthase/poly-beta-1,6-N-acetylglucosamine synthase-like glycosyltransferase
VDYGVTGLYRPDDQQAGVAALVSLAQRQLARRTDTGALEIEVRRLSRGSVARATRYGPVISPARRHRRLRKSTFSTALSAADRRVIRVLSVCWLVLLVDFWVWWLEPVHRTSLFGTVTNSIVLLYLTCYPVFYVVAVNRLRDVNPAVAVPMLRVAFIVTRAPSEPWAVARATLTAMLDQDFPLPYDVWLADEKPTAEILRWCSAYGVLISSRNGIEEYHRATWPRRTKCKEGNLAYFYDHWGYRHYDVVVQLDCDHKPSPAYLAEMVRPFSDPSVGYVAAPSVCDTNAAGSWSARGRLHREATFHGAFQLGHSAGWAPACIGSHYAVRTAALRDIGGLGPELAEDFSTSFLLSSAGWHGAFAINAEAHGDGPATVAAMLVQEYQWSKSLTVLFLKLVPPNLRRLPVSLRIRFLYHLFFYSLLVTSTLGGVLLAPAAAITGAEWVNVNYAAFLVHWWSLSLCLILLTCLLRRRGLLRPPDAKIVSWENWLYTLARWPYIARGICSAIGYAIRPRAVTFKVTPKGNGGLESLPVSLIVPYLVVSCAYSAAALIGEGRNNAVGYVFLCVLGAVLYAFVCWLIPLLHAGEMGTRTGLGTGAALRRTSLVPLVLGLLSAIPALCAAIRYPAYAEHVLHWHWHWHWLWLGHWRTLPSLVTWRSLL